MAGLTKIERVAKANHAEYIAQTDPDSGTEWKDLTPEEKAQWISRADGGDVEPDDDDEVRAPRVPEPVALPSVPLHQYKHESISITTPVPGRYVVTGFRAGTVYVPEVGHLAPPQQIDLPMTDDLADALLAVIADFRKGAASA